MRDVCASVSVCGRFVCALLHVWLHVHTVPACVCVLHVCTCCVLCVCEYVLCCVSVCVGVCVFTHVCAHLLCVYNLGPHGCQAMYTVPSRPPREASWPPPPPRIPGDLREAKRAPG